MTETAVAGPYSTYPKFTSGTLSDLKASTTPLRYWYDGRVALDCAPELPAAPGLYFVLDGDMEVLYVGESTNMRKRWFEGHHQFFRAKQQGGQWIGYIKFPAATWDDESAPEILKELLRKEEAALIRLYAPALNRGSVHPEIRRSRFRRKAVKYFERLATEARIGCPLVVDSLALFFYANESYLGREDAMVLARVAVRTVYWHHLASMCELLMHQDP
jgi:hypothetical protein